MQIHLTPLLLIIRVGVLQCDQQISFSLSLSLSSFVSRSDPFRSFVDYCLLKIPQDRPSSGELLKVSTPPLCNPSTVTSLPASVSPRGWVTLSHPRLPDYNTGKHTTTCTRTHIHRLTELLNRTRNCAPHGELVFVSFFLSVLLTISSFLCHALIRYMYTTQSHQHILESTPKYSLPNRLCIQTETKQNTLHFP